MSIQVVSFHCVLKNKLGQIISSSFNNEVILASHPQHQNLEALIDALKDLKTGENACPFNSLYWDFYDRNTEKLSRNPRIGMMYQTWNKMKPGDKAALLERAEWVKNNVDFL
jgi:deoxyribodipyrimidine photolyase-like uncharacterized protein